MSNVILTGLPRSGLTVVSALIDTLPDCVCLNEPKWHKRKGQQIKKPLPLCKWLVGDFAWRRVQMLHEKPIKDWRADDGTPLLDAIKDPRTPKDDSGKPVLVSFQKPGLTKDFTLAMKHHALYTAVLPELVQFEHFRIIAVVRHPLDTIQSWRSLKNRAIAQGKLPQAAKFWNEAARISLLTGDPLDRMVQMYDAFCQRYWELRDKIEIIKFEDVVENPKLVSKLMGKKELSPMASLIEQRQRVLRRDEADILKEKFRKYGVFTKHFYSI